MTERRYATLSKILILAALAIAFVCALVGFDVVHADLDSHVLGWGMAAVVLIALGLLLP